MNLANNYLVLVRKLLKFGIKLFDYFERVKIAVFLCFQSKNQYG